MDLARLCMGCMHERGEGRYCPECGWPEDGKEADKGQLPIKTILNDRYIIGRVLGQGGFGITYIAWDRVLNSPRAIKEFFPVEMVSRQAGSPEVVVFNQDKAPFFAAGLERFLNEARILARFEDDNVIVGVKDYFQGNNTAYLAMSYLEGTTLRQHLNQVGGRLPYDQLLPLIITLAESLEKIHQNGILHRDISPDNIFICSNSRVKLLDFGAARYSVNDASQGMSVILKPGYAPDEQYSRQGQQGPWTDVYALGATFYRAVTGQVPPAARERTIEDTLKPPSLLGISLPPVLEAVVMKSLAVAVADRYPDMSVFKAQLQAAARESGARGDMADFARTITVNHGSPVLSAFPGTPPGGAALIPAPGGKGRESDQIRPPYPGSSEPATMPGLPAVNWPERLPEAPGRYNNPPNRQPQETSASSSLANRLLVGVGILLLAVAIPLGIYLWNDSSGRSSKDSPGASSSSRHQESSQDQATNADKDKPADNTGPQAEVIDSHALDDPYHVTLVGQQAATSSQLKAILKAKNPSAPDLVDLYISMGKIYGIRGDVAFCHAAKETNWWRFGGLVQPWQNNFCGLGATGDPVTDPAAVSLNGADPSAVHFQAGVHGACFSTPEAGVEAHLQHLYAYVHAGESGLQLPSGRTLYDPRFTLVPASYKSVYWQDLSGRWAVPGVGFGQSIIDEFLKPALQY